MYVNVGINSSVCSFTLNNPRQHFKFPPVLRCVFHAGGGVDICFVRVFVRAFQIKILMFAEFECGCVT